jgi:hypothetical protein
MRKFWLKNGYDWFCRWVRRSLIPAPLGAPQGASAASSGSSTGPSAVIDIAPVLHMPVLHMPVLQMIDVRQTIPKCIQMRHKVVTTRDQGNVDPGS